MATAVVTSAMLRTWAVRLVASRLTLSVRSFQVPATPGTSACPPSLPSVPTVRATSVTCAANDAERVDHVVDGVGERGDLALRVDRDLLRQVAVGDRGDDLRDAAHLRRSGSTAMTFTLSVRSFQVPETPFTSAWPPSLPSVPTSFATRVTSAANELQLVDHGVDGVLQLEHLALGVDGDLLRQVAVGDGGRHLARCCAPGRSGSTARTLTLSVRSFQVPRHALARRPGRRAFPRCRPPSRRA